MAMLKPNNHKCRSGWSAGEVKRRRRIPTKDKDGLAVLPSFLQPLAQPSVLEISGGSHISLTNMEEQSSSSLGLHASLSWASLT